MFWPRFMKILTRINSPPPGGLVFQQTGTIVKLVQDSINLIKTNILTKFHEAGTIKVVSRVLTRKHAPLRQYIIGTNLWTKFHEERTINMASRVLTRIYYRHILNNAPSPGGDVFQQARNLFELIQDIIRTNALSKFYEDRTIFFTFRVTKRKNAPPSGGHVFQPTGTIFNLVQYIIETSLPVKFHDVLTSIIGTNNLTMFHDDWTIIMASRVLTRNKRCISDGHTDKQTDKRNDSSTAICHPTGGIKLPRPLGGHVFPPTRTIFELIQDIIGKNRLTKFHDDRKINMASRVLIRQNALPPGGHVLKTTGTIFELRQDIIGTNLLIKFHEDRKINVAYREYTRKNAPPTGGNIFQPTGILFKLVQDIIGLNHFTKFHEDRTINVASRVKNAPTLGSHFHEDQKINVASRLKNAPPPGGHVFQSTGIIF
ncbi:hypothetical protein DPMN_013753 [Dreissena polymorpha]|uniref:Uncharacterized protein n=1 Tax=Dreissena polymorpha TaxID=45954 RepID=A0A9D4N8C4_DREPO|nr:hypothetical protein DPMN_013753 [Dreissena polymorpha]